MVEPPDVENVGLSKLKSTPPVLVDPNFFVGCVHDRHHLRGKVNEVEFVCRTVSCSQSVICFYVFFFVRKEPGLQSWRDQRQRFQCQVHIAFSFVQAVLDFKDNLFLSFFLSFISFFLLFFPGKGEGFWVNNPSFYPFSIICIISSNGVCFSYYLKAKKLSSLYTTSFHL